MLKVEYVESLANTDNQSSKFQMEMLTTMW
jgi:hypothetical protein